VGNIYLNTKNRYQDSELVDLTLSLWITAKYKIERSMIENKYMAQKAKKCKGRQTLNPGSGSKKEKDQLGKHSKLVETKKFPINRRGAAAEKGDKTLEA
jgi:hypothetical protein